MEDEIALRLVEMRVLVTDNRNFTLKMAVPADLPLEDIRGMVTDLLDDQTILTRTPASGGPEIEAGEVTELGTDLSQADVFAANDGERWQFCW